MPNIITTRPTNNYISKFFIKKKKKINTTNREIKVDTCPLPRWTLKNDLFWKIELQIVIHVCLLYHRWAFVYIARISSGGWGTESFRIVVSIYVNEAKNKQNKTKRNMIFTDHFFWESVSLISWWWRGASWEMKSVAFSGCWRSLELQSFILGLGLRRRVPLSLVVLSTSSAVIATLIFCFLLFFFFFGFWLDLLQLFLNAVIGPMFENP